MKKADGASIETRLTHTGCRRCNSRLALLCLALIPVAACHKAEEPLSHEAIIQADMLEILELQGFPCDEVVKFEAGDRLDYRVECVSGEQYRILVSSEGHVGVEQQPQ